MPARCLASNADTVRRDVQWPVVSPISSLEQHLPRTFRLRRTSFVVRWHKTSFQFITVYSLLLAYEENLEFFREWIEFVMFDYFQYLEQRFQSKAVRIVGSVNAIFGSVSFATVVKNIHLKIDFVLKCKDRLDSCRV
jgi:hypothetical protein